ncbi:GNAT family N-acetyltransferase [Yoonia vestfoldensis]|uniref:GNAT family N-acetyltransferase n=1 Tax=Yoonia vestfoldensis TaxID=245188 RepID=UPI00036AD61B|nr:GNAT family N-acetyltransferase [Yoonia vestfoldensis]
MQIRDLNSDDHLGLVDDFYRRAPDYWLMADGRAPLMQKARDFFTDCPPGCDPALSRRIGLFLNGRLSGLAELSFGFPSADDAYLGFLMLCPEERNRGRGKVLYAFVEDIARKAGHTHLYLAVLDINSPARRFWEREGFRHAGVTGTNARGQTLTRLIKVLSC